MATILNKCNREIGFPLKYEGIKVIIRVIQPPAPPLASIHIFFSYAISKCVHLIHLNCMFDAVILITTFSFTLGGRSN